MSTEQTRNSLNQIEKEIVDLEKKSADLAKKEASANGSAAHVAKSISKNTTAATLKSKSSQIGRQESEALKAKTAKADIDKKIADKRKKRAGILLKRQKEEAADQKKVDKAQANLQLNYEQRIGQLTDALNTNIALPKQNHLYTEINAEEYDVFISHASEDKGSIADNLYYELDSRGIKVWYDAISIQWGDSLRSKIDDGLRNSKFGIVILSNDYIRKGWTQYELDGLFQREMTDGKTVLPIWHKITKDEVQAFSQTLASRKALNTAMLSASEIADELIRLLPPIDSDETAELMEDTQNG